MFDGIGKNHLTGCLLSLSYGVLPVLLVLCAPALAAWQRQGWAEAFQDAGALMRAGKYQEADSQFAAILRQAREAKASGESIAEVESTWGLTKAHLGHYTDAEGLYLSALRIEKDAGREIGLQTGRILLNLASLHIYQGRQDQAERMVVDSLTITGKMLKPDPRLRVTALNALATIRRKQYRLREAEDLAREALMLVEATDAERDRLWADVASELALILERKGVTAGVDGLLRDVLAVRERINGSGHVLVALTSGNLATVLGPTHPAEAERLLRRALSILQSASLPGYAAQEGATKVSLAGLLMNGAKDDEAESLLREVIASSDEGSGRLSGELADAKMSLGWLREKQRRFDEAEAQYRHAWKIRERIDGSGHVATAGCLTGLARVEIARSRYNAADLLQSRALQTLEKFDGAEGRDTLFALGNMVLIRLGQRRYAEAETLSLRLLSSATKKPGLDPSGHAALLANLGISYFHQKQYSKAEDALRKALEIRAKARGANSGEDASVLTMYSNTLKKLGRKAEARDVEIRRNSLQRQGRQ